MAVGLVTLLSPAAADAPPPVITEPDVPTPALCTDFNAAAAQDEICTADLNPNGPDQPVEPAAPDTLQQMVKVYYGDRYSDAVITRHLDDIGYDDLMNGPLTDGALDKFLDRLAGRFGCFPDSNGEYHHGIGPDVYNLKNVKAAIKAEHAGMQSRRPENRQDPVPQTPDTDGQSAPPPAQDTIIEGSNAPTGQDNSGNSGPDADADAEIVIAPVIPDSMPRDNLSVDTSGLAGANPKKWAPDLEEEDEILDTSELDNFTVPEPENAIVYGQSPFNGPFVENIDIPQEEYSTVLLPGVLKILESDTDYDKERASYIRYTIEQVMAYNACARKDGLYELDPYAKVNQLFCESNYHADPPQNGYHVWGIGQFKRATGRIYGLHTTSDLKNPWKSISASIQYTGDLTQKYGGNERLARFAYNGGLDGIEYLSRNVGFGAWDNIDYTEAQAFLDRQKNIKLASLKGLTGEARNRRSRIVYNSWAYQTNNYVKKCHADNLTSDQRQASACRMQALGFYPIDGDMIVEPVIPGPASLQNEFQLVAADSMTMPADNLSIQNKGIIAAGQPTQPATLLKL